MQKRLQSSLEYLSTYGLVILIIIVALGVVFFFVGLPKSVQPNRCNIYGGLNCIDIGYSNTSNGLSAVEIIASDLQPGALNITGFSASILGKGGASGYCTPSIIFQGQSTYCIADLNGGSTPGLKYSGNATINATYCPTVLHANSMCSLGNGANDTFGASFSVQAEPFSPSTTSIITTTIPYLPCPSLPPSLPTLSNSVSFTLYNDQPVATQAGFQEMINFSASTYPSYVSSDLGNIRFYSGNTELYSWCEANCNSSSKGNAVFWLSLPSPIGADGGSNTLTLKMYFVKGLDYDGVCAGEAPQLSPTYAQYDNGAKIFGVYDNFAVLNNSRWATEHASYTTSNGITLTAGSVYSKNPLFMSQNTILEVDIAAVGLFTNNNAGSGFGQSNINNVQEDNTGEAATILIKQENGVTGSPGSYQDYSADGKQKSFDIQSGDSILSPNLYTYYIIGSTVSDYDVGELINYTLVDTGSGNLFFNTNQYIILGSTMGSTAPSTNLNTPISIHWIRIRDIYPYGTSGASHMPVAIFSGTIN